MYVSCGSVLSLLSCFTGWFGQGKGICKHGSAGQYPEGACGVVGHASIILLSVCSPEPVLIVNPSDRANIARPALFRIYTIGYQTRPWRLPCVCGGNWTHSAKLLLPQHPLAQAN